jgi:hypothetical protein
MKYRLCQRKCEPKKKKKFQVPNLEEIQKYFFRSNHINQENQNQTYTTLLASKVFKNLPSPITLLNVISLKITKTNLEHHIQKFHCLRHFFNTPTPKPI